MKTTITPPKTAIIAGREVYPRTVNHPKKSCMRLLYEEGVNMSNT